MESKREVIAVGFLFGIILFVLLFFSQSFSLIVKNSLAAAMAILFYLLLFTSFRQKRILETEQRMLSKKLANLSVVSNQLNTCFIDFYNQLTSIQRFIKPVFFQNEEITIKETFSGDELIANADLIINKTGQLVEMINNERDQFLKAFQESSEKKREDNKEIILEIQYYSDIISEFMASIIKNFNESTEPLSKGIYNIKLRTNDFLENVTKWNKDLNDDSSDKNFDKIITKYNHQNSEFKDIFSNLDENYNSLEKSLNTILSKFKILQENAEAISEISENIRILSINASLEAVRAGSFGKGFKIVADEVKKLSGTTQSYVKHIIPMIVDTNNMMTNTLENFEVGRKKIVDEISNQKNEFDTFYEFLTDYYQDFNKIFSFISKVITDVNLNIDNLVPIFHLSNLSLQEMENLNRMVQIFLNKHQTDISKTIQNISREEKKLVLNSLISTFNKETTTEKELDVINRIFEKLGFEKINIKKTDKVVDLF